VSILALPCPPLCPFFTSYQFIQGFQFFGPHYLKVLNMVYQCLANFLFVLIGSALAAHSPTCFAPSLKTLYTFSSNIWIENLVIHSPSTIILSQFIPNGALYTFNPLEPSSSPNRIHAFSTSTNIVGITEYASSSYAFVSVDYNSTSGAPEPGSQSLWTLDLAISPPRIVKIVDLPKAGFLNGVTVLSTDPPRVLISDSLLGAVWKVDIDSKDAKIVLQDDDTMLPDLNIQPVVGINGLRYDVRTDTVFYTNTGKGIFASIKVDPRSGAGKGTYDILSTRVLGADDFGLSMDRDASYGMKEKAYVAGHGTNQLWKVVIEGGKATKDTVANVTMPTSVQILGNGHSETAYITTAIGEILEYTPKGRCDDQR
jgi:hypothetical protein